MRIIRILMIAGLILTIFGGNKAFAMTIEDTNETKINLKNDEKSPLITILAYNNLDSWSLFPVQSEKTEVESVEPEKTPEDLERERILARFSDKIEKANLPAGKFEINASAYTAAADECGKSDGITASGVLVKENRTLACPKQFPLGVKIRIEGFGTFVCEDRGGAIKNNHFDIYMQTKKEAFAFGRRNLMAEVVI